MRSLLSVVSEWCTDQFNYHTGSVTPEIAVFRPVQCEKVKPDLGGRGRDLVGFRQIASTNNVGIEKSCCIEPCAVRKVCDR